MSDLLSDRLRASTDPQFEEDWKRQRRTASDILTRLQAQEGVILADQVGMGKTYVALAVAVSQILSTPELGQVITFVPPSVADKWVREWQKFSETLLEPGTGIRCVHEPIRSGEEFFKALATTAKLNLHITVPYGSNNHHIAEAIFKATAKALRMAVENDDRNAGVPSTKGTL